MTVLFDTELKDNLQRLRSIARKMAPDRASADDLLQDTLIRMLDAQARYAPGSNLVAWAYRIMRNRHISNIRSKRNDTLPLDHPVVLSVGQHATQDGRIAHNEMVVALRQLPSDQRVAMLLVGGWGLDYSEVARRQRCSVGTIKSRVSRGRERVRAWMLDDEAATRVRPIDGAAVSPRAMALH